MQEENDQLNRRTFLKFTGAAAAGLAGRSSFARSAEGANEGSLNTRAQPSNPIILKSPDLEIALDRHDGLPYEYRLATGKRRMRGEDLGKPILTTCYNKTSGTFSTISASAQSWKVTSN